MKLFIPEKVTLNSLNNVCEHTQYENSIHIYMHLYIYTYENVYIFYKFILNECICAHFQ